MTGRQQKWVQTELAIHAAHEHAERDIPEWKDTAYSLLLQFAKQADKPFCADQVGEWAYRNGLPEPPTRMAWGGVFLKASRAKIIRKAYIGTWHYPNRQCTHTMNNTFWELVR